MTIARANIELPDRYRVSGHVANGGMASVWAAEDNALGRLVAVKLLAMQFTDDPSAIERFQREARTAARLSNHPHVVTIYDVDEHAGRPYIVMEYMDGGSLAAIIRSGRLTSQPEALGWLRQAADALDFAHERNVVHRDIKPANLLLDGRQRLAIGDFGIARVAYETTITETGQVMGTAAYLAPEQAMGEPVTPASDRYSLAVVAYELLTGARPHVADNFAAQARMKVDEDPAPPTEREPALPVAVDDVLLRGLARDPDERWPTSSALVCALEGAIAGQATQAMPPPTAPTAVAPPPPAPSPRRPPRQPEAVARPGLWPADPRRRRLAPVVALGALASLVLVVAAIALIGSGEDRRADSGSTQPAAPPPATTAAPDRRREATAPAAPSAAPEGAETTEDPAVLNDEGFRLLNAGRPQDAIALLERATRDCPVSTTDPCAYALFNLGQALRAAGRPAEAIPVLEQRLENPNQRDRVQQELDAARGEAGQGPSSGAAPDEGDGRGREKRMGKGRGEEAD